MPQFLKEKGERLADSGYYVLPIPPGTKGCLTEGWRNIRADAAQVRRWYSNGSANAGAGVLGVNTPAIDVDILDPQIAQQMSDILDSIFGPGLLARVGMAPKFLVPFRCEKPFSKMYSRGYTDDGIRTHKIEILADGQQWVAFHVHPDTGKPYYWGGGRSIADVPNSELPILTPELAQRVIDAFEEIAQEKVLLGEWSVKTDKKEKKTDAPPASDFDAYTEPTDLTPEQVVSLIHKVTDYDDRETWLRIGRMVHHHFSGEEEGFEIWEAWSTNGQKYDAEDQRRVWDSFGKSDKPETLRALLKELGQPEKQEHKPRATSDNPFAIQKWEDYKQNYLSTPWIIKGVLPQAEVGILYGQSGSGKTFFVLDMAACVARGEPWRGRKVSSCRVVYVAAEAREGIKKRMDAYDQHISPDGVRPDIIASAPNLLSTDTKQLIEAIGSAGLIILDTMAASHSGDENSAKDMGLFLAACKDISVATGAMVLAVHHTGKEDSKGMRGSSALFAGADFVMEIFKNKVGDRFEHGAMLSKSRDDVTGTSFGFELKRVTVGVDDEGDDVTTCVIEPVQKEVSKTPKRPRKLANLEDSRYDMHREILTIFERITDESPTKMVTDDQLLDAVIKKFPSKLRRNMVPLVLRLEEFGVIRRTEAGLSLADDDLEAC